MTPATKRLILIATSALQALRSYEYGNSSTELADEVADALELAIEEALAERVPDSIQD